jgi:transposase InsO family protein
VIEHVRRALHVSERRACKVLGQYRSTQRKRPQGRDDEAELIADVIELARQYGRYGYRKIAELLRTTAGWVVNDKRVERIWRQEGLKVPAKQPKRGRLWLADGSCIRLRPEHRNHVWSYDFVEHRTHEGRKYRMLNIIDEYAHECLAIRVARRLNSTDVIDVLSDLFILRGVPGHIRSDNGPEFIAKAVQDWIAAVGAMTAYNAPGSFGRTATSRASTPGCVTSCSTARSSTRYAKPRSSSRAGASTTTPCVHMRRSAIGRQPQNCSCPALLPQRRSGWGKSPH